ncbi:serine hydrolase [Mycobacterium sp. THU-M104]|uniref:serine hydrolase n=1 Tax=Mycobacterium sp. THU-M104 TaxID=3410515 RepID=UPI003B9BC18C
MTKRRATAAVVMVFLALTGCGSAQHLTAPSPPVSKVPPAEASGVVIPPGRIGDAVAKVDGLVADLMKTSGIPGMALAIVHGGKTLYAKGFGVRDASRGDDPDNRVDADTVFQLASVSKSVGATVVAHAVTEKVIAWDTPVASVLPWFSLSDPYVTGHVTVADFYSHRSGLPDHAGDQLEDLGYDRRQTLERLKYLPLGPFRNRYAYTNFGVSAAAEAVAAVAGKPWEELSAEVLSSGRTELSHSGAFTMGAATNFVVLPSEDLAIVALTNAAPIGVPETLTAEFLDLVQYGQIREDWAGLYQKATGWMNNPEGSLVGKQPPADPAPARPLGEYLGVYTSDYWGRAIVAAHDGGLQLAMGPKNRTFPLTHWDGDTFTFPLPDENAAPGTISKAVFSGSPDATLNVEYFDTDKLGTFTR